MRNGWRKAGIAWGIVLLGTTCPAAPQDSTVGPAVRLTVEVGWSLPDLPALPEAPEPTGVLLEMSDGRVVEALGWPSGTSTRPSRRDDGSWVLGREPTGRVRARVEAPIGASLKVHA